MSEYMESGLTKCSYVNEKVIYDWMVDSQIDVTREYMWKLNMASIL